ncbi:unnamed protein product, partial [Musa acuminata subsp. burmannicoides]
MSQRTNGQIAICHPPFTLRDYTGIIPAEVISIIASRGKAFYGSSRVGSKYAGQLRLVDIGYIIHRIGDVTYACVFCQTSGVRLWFGEWRLN